MANDHDAPAISPQPSGTVAAERRTGDASVAQDAGWTQDG